MTQPSTLTIAALHERVEAIFLKAGLNAVQAGALARVIVAGERDACKSHGIYRIEGALRTVKAGKVKPDAVPVLDRNEGSAIVKVDAKGGFANPAFELGVPALAERARKLGIAALVINDCTHFSALWPEVEAVTNEGLAALVMCPSYATVAPTGGNKPHACQGVQQTYNATGAVQVGMQDILQRCRAMNAGDSCCAAQCEAAARCFENR